MHIYRIDWNIFMIMNNYKSINKNYIIINELLTIILLLFSIIIKIFIYNAILHKLFFSCKMPHNMPGQKCTINIRYLRIIWARSCSVC